MLLSIYSHNAVHSISKFDVSLSLSITITTNQFYYSIGRPKKYDFASKANDALKILEKNCQINHLDGDGEEMENLPVHLEVSINEYTRLKQSADTTGNKTVSEMNGTVQNEIIGEYGITGMPTVTTERSSVRAKNIADGHDIVERNSSSSSVSPQTVSYKTVRRIKL